MAVEDEGCVGSLRVGLIDADRLHNELLAAALCSRPDLSVAFTVPSPDDISPAHDAHVLLFRARFPSEAFGDGLALEYWRTRCPVSRIVLLTPCRAPKTIRAVMAAGVDGYAIHSAITVDALCELLQRAHYSPPAICEESQRILRQPSCEDELTFRELQAVQLLHRFGPSARKRAAQCLDMSEKTLSVHLRNVCRKLQVSGAVAAIRRCVEMGLVE